MKTPIGFLFGILVGGFLAFIWMQEQIPADLFRCHDQTRYKVLRDQYGNAVSLENLQVKCRKSDSELPWGR